MRYWFFGFELVNVSAGVFILLSEHATKFVASFMILYVILVVTSFFFEDDKAEITHKFMGNLLISIIVISVTLYAFLGFEGLKEKPAADNGANTTAQPRMFSWKVGVPYLDTSLNRNFNAKTESIQSFYVVEVTAVSREDAIKQAKLIFFSDKGPVPFVPKAEKTIWSMIVVESQMIAERISN